MSDIMNKKLSDLPPEKQAEAKKLIKIALILGVIALLALLWRILR